MKQETLMNEDLGQEDYEAIDAEYDDESFSEYDDDDDDDESFSEYDDDDDDENESEDAEILSMLAPALIGGLAPTVIKGVSRIFSPPKHRSRNYRKFSPFRSGGGIKGARLRTPRGSAFLRLPKSVVPMTTYRKDMRQLQLRDNRLNSRINRAQRDISKTDKKARQAFSLGSRANVSVNSLSKKHKKDIAKLKEDQQSGTTMNMLMSMMQMQKLSTQLNEHTHDTTSGQVANVGTQDNMMMMLPLLMMGDSDGDDSTMMMLVMMMMNQQNQPKS